MSEQQPTVKQRAALYLRVSTARQAEHDVSIPDQRRQGEAYCEARGYELVETYVEPGASATNDRRPEFQRMMEAGTSKPAAFDIVVVHSFSRFFRDHFELEFYVRKLAKNGVKLVSMTQELGAKEPVLADARHDASDHGPVRRIPVEGEREAYASSAEGKRSPGLLERVIAAGRLPCHRGRRARSPDHRIEKYPAAGPGGFKWRRNGGERRSHFCSRVAEREGFEPPIELPLYRISSAALSTAQPPLRTQCRAV